MLEAVIYDIVKSYAKVVWAFVRRVWRALAKIMFCCVALSLVSDYCLSSSISVSPTKIEAVMHSKGESFLITVTNPSIEDVQVDVKCVELLQTNDGVIGLGRDFDNLPWIKVYPTSFKLEAFQKQVISVNVEPVPQGVIGTYCAVVFAFSSLSENSDKVHSRGQIVTQLMLSDPSRGIIDGEIQIMHVRPGFCEGEFNVDVGFANTGTKLVAATCKVNLVAPDGEFLISDTMTLRNILPGAYITCTAVLNVSSEIFKRFDMYDIACEVTCVDVFDPTDIRVFRDSVNIAVFSGGSMVFPELKIVDIRVPVTQEGKPVKIGVLVSNTGNMPVNTDGTIRISDLSGEMILEEPVLLSNLLPDSSSFIESAIDHFLISGEYMVDVHLAYSVDNALCEIVTEPNLLVITDRKLESISRAVLKVVPPNVKIGVRADIVELDYVDGAVMIETVLEGKGATIVYEGLIQLFGGDGTLVGYVPIQRNELKSETIHRFTKFWHGHLPPGIYEAVLSVFVMDLDMMITKSVFFKVPLETKKDDFS